jgi:hypothetical protein
LLVLVLLAVEAAVGADAAAEFLEGDGEAVGIVVVEVG